MVRGVLGGGAGDDGVGGGLVGGTGGRQADGAPGGGFGAAEVGGVAVDWKGESVFSFGGLVERGRGGEEVPVMGVSSSTADLDCPSCRVRERGSSASSSAMISPVEVGGCFLLRLPDFLLAGGSAVR